jgi:AbrB family transcriptional regulator (stage V sporulation protein T)
MKATGIVRRIDDLGRVVIPKEIRRTLRIREGDPLEIYVDHDGEVILKKYSPVGELGDFANEFVESLHESVKHIVMIADRDRVIAVAGAPKKEYLEKPIGRMIEEIMEGRKSILQSDPGPYELFSDMEGEIGGFVVVPIIASGDSIGAVILWDRENSVKIGTVEQKLCETVAAFLGKQFEQ